MLAWSLHAYLVSKKQRSVNRFADHCQLCQPQLTPDHALTVMPSVHHVCVRPTPATGTLRQRDQSRPSLAQRPALRTPHDRVNYERTPSLGQFGSTSSMDTRVAPCAGCAYGTANGTQVRGCMCITRYVHSFIGRGLFTGHGCYWCPCVQSPGRVICGCAAV